MDLRRRRMKKASKLGLLIACGAALSVGFMNCGQIGFQANTLGASSTANGAGNGTGNGSSTGTGSNTGTTPGSPASPSEPTVTTICESSKPDIDTSGARRVLRVGPNRSLKTPSAAAAIAQANDIIQIEAATYKCDSTKWSASGLLIQGTCGRPHLDADGCTISNGKGIWNPTSAVVGMTIENIEFSGAKVADMNGAGLRWDGTGTVTVRGCYFHHNQNGILFTPIDQGPNSTTDLTVANSEFGYNGAGDGYSHNMYIGTTRTFTLIGSYSHHSVIGHLVKSRALNNFVLYNRIADEADGTSSYTIDFPQGGTSYVIGNIIHQGTKSPNNAMIEFSEEGTTNPTQKLYVAFNTIHNEIASAGVGIVIFDKSLAEAVIADNFFVGFADQDHVLRYGTTGSTKRALLQSNVAVVNPAQAGFQDLSSFNYSLTAASPAKGAGSDPGSYNGQSLLATQQYRHPVMLEARTATGSLSVGALE